MKGFIALNLLVFSFFVLAGSENEYCQGTTKPVSLYDKGKSLYGVKAQDQDGLETCYANTASLIIKSYNPDKPVPSYLDIASYNKPDENQKYDFNTGLTCESINTIKNNNISLCQDGIIENQPKSVQDEILLTLYNVINDYNYSPAQMDKTLALYAKLIEDDKFVSFDCNKKIYLEGGLEEYLYRKFRNFITPSSYLGKGTPSLAEKNFANNCAKNMRESFSKANIIEENRYLLLKRAYGNYKFSFDFISDRIEKYMNILDQKKLPSGKSVLEVISEKIESQKSYKGTVSKISSLKTAESYQHYLQIQELIKDVDTKFANDMMNEVYRVSPNLRSCIDKVKPQFTQVKGQDFLNAMINSCRMPEKNWNERIDEDAVAASCAAGDIELLTTLKTLTSLGETTNTLKKYLVENDKNILRQVISNNCKGKHKYSLPGGSCQLKGLHANLVDVSSYSDWKQYKEILKQIEKIYSSKSNLGLNSVINEFVSDIEKRQRQGDQFAQSYSAMLSELFGAVGQRSTISKSELISILETESQRVYKTSKDIGQNIFSKLKNGKAVGISTCNSLFHDLDKGNYEGCNNHSVAITGYKCVSGKLKVELSNSYGIGCVDNKNSKSLMECERDIDGLTNGRSWVDFDYITNFGMAVNLL